MLHWKISHERNMIHLEEILMHRSPQQRLREFTKQRLNGQCIYCGYFFDSLTCDHVKPRSKGGRTTHFNLVPACVSCNESKGSKDVWEWWEASPYWLDALDSGRVAILKRILADERSLAEWLVDLLKENPTFRAGFYEVYETG